MKIDTNQMIRSLSFAVLGCVIGCLVMLLPTIRAKPTLPVIAFIPRTTGTNFAEDMHRGAKAAALSAGYQIYWNAPTREDDVDRQILIAESAVNRGAKALILGPTNPGGVTTMIDGLEARKIPVVVVQSESPVPAGQYVTSVVPDQSQFGRIAAERIAHVLGGTGEVAIVGLDRGTPETIARARSFIEAIAAYPEVKVVAQSPGSVQTPEAEQSAREIVKSFPRLKAIFAVSANATQGTILALEESGMMRSIDLVGSDRDLFLVDSLRAGKLDSIVAVDGYRVGVLAVQAALPGVNRHVLEAPKLMEPTLITRDNVESFATH